MTSIRGNTATPSPIGGPGRRADGRKIPWLRLGSALAGAVALGVLVHQRLPEPPVTAARSAPFGPGETPGAPAAGSVRTAWTAAAGLAEREVSIRSREWVERLSKPGLAGSLTLESATAWDEERARLIASGSEAIPAIREFLARKGDDDWGAGARRVLGYDSAREAMFAALVQIGGAEAEAALAAALADTLLPREIALLARDLELLAPGQYGPAAVQAALQSLAAAGQGALGDRDVAPVFEVLNRLGGGAVATELEGVAAHWNHYATLALARLPDGAGVSSLVRMAEGPGQGSGPATDPAIRMLGSLVLENEGARTAFLELVRNDRIAAGTWNQLGPILAGAQMQLSAGVFGGETPLDHGGGVQRIHINFGNQNFTMGQPAVAAPAEYWERQLAWLDQLSSVATTPAAQTAIQDAWKRILDRLGPLTAVSVR